MFLHLGKDIMIDEKDIIAIFNYDFEQISDINSDFLKITDEEGFLTLLCAKEHAKSFVLTTNKIFITPISAGTLEKRVRGDVFIK